MNNIRASSNVRACETQLTRNVLFPFLWSLQGNVGRQDVDLEYREHPQAHHITHNQQNPHLLHLQTNSFQPGQPHPSALGQGGVESLGLHQGLSQLQSRSLSSVSSPPPVPASSSSCSGAVTVTSVAGSSTSHHSHPHPHPHPHAAWMSFMTSAAVAADNQPHHQHPALGNMHYLWNGVEVSKR
jgi:hypothetical protein